MAETSRESEFRLLDTPILVHYTRSDAVMEYVEKSFGLLSNPNVLISVVSNGEVRALALKFGWGKAKISRLDEILQSLTIVPIPFLNIVEAYAQIERLLPTTRIQAWKKKRPLDRRHSPYHRRAPHYNGPRL